MVTFPELHCESTLELPAIGALSAVVGGLLLPISWLLGTIAFIPCGADRAVLPNKAGK